MKCHHAEAAPTGPKACQATAEVSAKKQQLCDFPEPEEISVFRLRNCLSDLGSSNLRLHSIKHVWSGGLVPESENIAHSKPVLVLPTPNEQAPQLSIWLPLTCG